MVVVRSFPSHDDLGTNDTCSNWLHYFWHVRDEYGELLGCLPFAQDVRRSYFELVNDSFSYSVDGKCSLSQICTLLDQSESAIPSTIVTIE